MKGNNEPSEFTEEQAIHITIENGYNGAEFETAIWKQRKCLKPDRTLTGLINKLETIYNSVEVTGIGKKRKYILNDKKTHITAREFNYKGTIPTPEDEVMTEYIFNILLTYPEGFNKSYKGWSKLLGFIDTDAFKVEEMIKELKHLHRNFPMIYNPREAVSVFMQTLNTRNRDIIEKSFKRLVRDNRIHIEEIYNIKTVNGYYETIEDSYYNEIVLYVDLFLADRDISYSSYFQSLTSIHKTQRMKKVIEEVATYLKRYYGIEYTFKTFSISIVDETIKQNVTYDEFNKAYYNRLIKLTQDRQSKKEYDYSKIFRKRFYLINTISLLKYLNIKLPFELLPNLKEKYISQVDDYSLDCMIETFNNDIDNEINNISFGIN